MIYLAGIFITCFLVFLLTGKKNKTPADSILMLWLCVIAFHLTLFYLFISGKIYDFPFLLGTHLPVPLLHGPLLFLYTAALTGQHPKYKKTWYLHFIPVGILYLGLIPFFRLSAAEKINVYRNFGAGFEQLIKISFILIVISGIAYVTASLFLLRRYRKSIENEFSNIEKINLAWLRYIIYGIAVIWIAVIFENDPVIFGVVVVFVFFLGYFGIRQTGIFASGPQPDNVTGPEQSSNNESDENGPITTTGRIKYEKSGLHEDQAEKIYQRLSFFMEDQKLFAEPELTLAVLAKHMDVHPNHLSQVINSYEGKNFYDYINLHRIEEFKRLAPHPDNRNYTLLSLAYECGFNSKTSFNRNFRKATGISPSEYLHQLNISLK